VTEETIITNVGEDDRNSVASEATMLLLLAAMKDLAKKSGKDPASTEAKTKKMADDAAKKSAEEARDALEGKTKAVKDAAKATKQFRSVLSGMLGGAIGLAVNGLTGLTKELLTGGDRLSDFTRHIPIVGSLITPLTEFIESTVDSFRSLSSVGAGFGNSLEDLRRSAATARLPLEEFAGLIQNNSERMIFLGSTVTEGARRFAEISGELRGDNGLFGALKTMGFTTEEVNEGLADYISLQGRLGRLQGKTNAELSAGAAGYLMQLDRLAKVTGRQRQDIEKDLERLNLDAGVRALEQNLERMFGPDSQEARNYRESLGLISSLPEGMQDAARSMLLGLPTEEAAQLMALGGEDLFQALQEVAQGADPSILQEAFLATFENLQSQLPDGQEAGTFIEGLRRSSPVMAGFFDSMFELDRLGKANLATAAAEQAQQDNIIENLTRFDDRIREVRATIQEALIDSGIFELVATSVASLASLINGPEGMARIKNSIETFANFLERLINNIKEGGIVKTIGDLFSDVLEEMKLRLFGGTRDTSRQQEEVGSRIQELQNQRTGITARDPGNLMRTEGERKQLELLDAQIEQLRNRAADLADPLQNQFEGMLSFSNLFSSPNREELNRLLNPVNDRIQELEERRNQIISGGEFGLVDENTSAELENINQELAVLKEEAASIKEEHSGGFLGGLINNIISLEGLLVGGAIIAGITAFSLALGTVAVKAALVIGAIGFAAGGIGFMLEQLDPVIETIGETFTNVFNTIPDIVRETGTQITSIIDSVFAGITTTIEALTETFNSVFVGIESIIDTTGTQITSIIDSVFAGITTTIEALTETFNTVFSGAETVINSVGEAISNIADSISGGLTDVINSLTGTVNTVFDGINEIISTVGDTIQGTIDSITEGIGNIIGKITEFKTAGTDATTNQIERLSQIDPANLLAAAEGITAMKSALDGFSSGAGSTLDRIGSFFGRQTSEDRQTSAFERLANLGPGLTEVSEALSEIASIENIGENIGLLTEDLDIGTLRDFNNQLERMLTILEGINQELSRDTRRRGGRGRRAESASANPAADALASGLGASSGSDDHLVRLNTTMTELLRVAEEQLQELKDIDDNTDNLSADVSRGGITRFAY
jgi:phage-related protein